MDLSVSNSIGNARQIRFGGGQKTQTPKLRESIPAIDKLNQYLAKRDEKIGQLLTRIEQQGGDNEYRRTLVYLLRKELRIF